MARTQLSKAFPTAEKAAFWGVEPGTVYRWRRRHGDKVVLDDSRLAMALVREPRTPHDIREKAREIVGEDPAQSVGTAAIEALNDLPDLRRRTEGHLAAKDAEIIEARRRGDKVGESLAAKQFKEYSQTLTGIIRAQALIGQDAGELIAKSEALRIVNSWASRAALGCQRVRDQLAKRLINKPDETAVCEVLDDVLISEIYLAPFARAVDVKAGCSLPEWFVDEINTAIGDFVADGEAELRKEQDGIRD